MIEKDKPVDTKEFWKERIEQARAGGSIRHSVYRAPEDMWQKMNKNHVDILNRMIDTNDDVLDAGCGYGRGAFIIPNINGRYVGVDQSPDFIKIAQGIKPSGEACEVVEDSATQFYCANLNNLPFKDNEFDWSVCISVMIMVVQNLGWSEWEQIQNELLRVSKKGILCLEYGKGDTDTTSDTYYVIKKDKK